MRPAAWIILTTLVLFPACQKPETHTGAGPRIGHSIGDTAPDFTLRRRDGSTFQLSQHRGKLIVLNFWATWCGPCRAEMPSMEKLSQAMKEKPFALVAVSVDEEGWSIIDPFVTSFGLQFPIVWDEKGEVARQFRSYRYPETFIIGADGKILDKRVGAMDWNTPQVLQMLQQKLPSPAKTGNP